jgi:hypothetical protein
MLKSTIRTLSPQRALMMASATAALAMAAIGFSGAAQARSDVQFSVGVAMPGVQVGVSNAYPVYSQPVYTQPVYVQQQPVYMQPRPVYVQPQPVYMQAQPVYYAPPRGWQRRHGHHGYDRRGGYNNVGYSMQNQAPQPYVHGPRGFQPQGYYPGR